MRALMEMVQGPKDERRAGLVWGGGKGGQWGRSRERERERERGCRWESKTASAHTLRLRPVCHRWVFRFRWRVGGGRTEAWFGPHQAGEVAGCYTFRYIFYYGGLVNTHTHTHTHTRGAHGVSGFSIWHPSHSIEQRARQAPQSKQHVCVMARPSLILIILAPP